MVEEIEQLEQIVKEFRRHKKFWTIQDLAEFLEISKRTAWDMVKKGEIEAVKIKGEWRIYHSWVVEYLKNNHSLNKD